MSARYLTIAAIDDPVGVEIADDIQGVTTRLETATPVSPEPTEPDNFVFPVDVAARLDTTALRIPQHVNLIVRTMDGRVVAEGANRNEMRVPDGEYVVEITSLAVKTYLAVEGSLRSTTDDVGRRLLLDDTDDVRLGVRSMHEFPATTVTTTDRPADLARALSCLGSALKTDSPERSWPTLRGHPPLLELGDDFDAPPGFERTDGPIRIEVPPNVGFLFPVAPLAYYLGAQVMLGDRPRLVAGGESYPLDAADGFERTVHRTLERLFTLDCIVRTEGLYPVDLDARSRVEADLPFDPAALYDASLVEQVRTFLDTPHRVVEPVIPTWKSTVDLAPTAENLVHVPFAAADLARVRCPRPATADATTEPLAAIEDFYRADGGVVRGVTRQPESPDPPTSPFGEDVTVVQPEPTDTIEHVWVGDGVPMGASKPTLEACKRRLEAQPSGAIEVAVVSNSPEMRAELDVRDLYGLRELVAFDIDIYEDLTGTELASVLADDYDFVHYVGHVDGDGMQCADGPLDATTLDTVGARAFVLNACRSYEQGVELVEKGATAGVVTLAEVANEPATRVGRTLARLLNAGFSMAGALDILRKDSITGRQYTVVGDAQVQIASSRGGTPIYTTIAERDSEYLASLYAYPTSRTKLGSICVPYIADNDTYYLNSGAVGEFLVDEDELHDYLGRSQLPVRIDGRLRWRNEVLAEMRENDR
ncbi:CHAT domain-containing protein [Halomarina rubra]|uniref:CHAT domain-containing protein n=1 Tax=Halomarina rubra TaxID=2071873 RepID=A0ABD6AUY2_9EURY|nr:CHAT domain-containing protein [Halomarina rubra]